MVFDGALNNSLYGRCRVRARARACVRAGRPTRPRASWPGPQRRARQRRRRRTSSSACAWCAGQRKHTQPSAHSLARTRARLPRRDLRSRRPPAQRHAHAAALLQLWAVARSLAMIIHLTPHAHSQKRKKKEERRKKKEERRTKNEERRKKNEERRRKNEKEPEETKVENRNTKQET